jgi:hypothetical protein
MTIDQTFEFLARLNPEPGETLGTLRHGLAREGARADVECFATTRVEDPESSTGHAYDVTTLLPSEHTTDADRLADLRTVQRAARLLVMIGAAVEHPERPGWLRFVGDWS